jgi:YVTN family beta-propeller protein
MKRDTSKSSRVGCILLVIFLFCSFALLPEQIQATNEVTATITGFNVPYAVAVTPNGAYAYVTNINSNTVSVISTATNKVTSTVTVGSAPYGLAAAPNGVYIYVVNTSGGSVSVINTATNTLTATVNVGYRPFRVAITPNSAYAYVANYGSNTVSVINTATNTLTATVNVGSYPYDVAVTPNGAYAYVTNQYGGTISVINTATNTVTSTIHVGFDPFGVAFTPNGAYAYVTEYSSVSGGTNTVSVIATATNTITATITVGENPSKVAVTPNGAYAYVTNQGDATIQSGTVSVISTSTNTVTATIPVGNGPYDVAFTPDGAYAYVANQYGKSVSVISTGTASSGLTSPSNVNFEVSTNLITNNLLTIPDFQKFMTLALPTKLYADDTILIVVTPSNLVQSVKLNFGNVVDQTPVTMTKTSGDTYAYNLKLNDPTAFADFLWSYGFAVGTRNLPGEIFDQLPSEITSRLPRLELLQPRIVSVTITDIYGKSQDMAINKDLPTAENLLPQICDPTTTICVLCPVDLLVTDSKGRSIGAVYDKGTFVENLSEIPGGYYVGEYETDSIKMFILPFSNESYKITGYAFGTGNYNLTVMSTPNQLSYATVNSKSGNIVAGSTLDYSLAISVDGTMSLGEQLANNTSSPPSGIPTSSPGTVQGIFLPIEVVYAIAIVAITAIIAVAIVLIKRK